MMKRDLSPTLAGIEEELRLTKLDAAELRLPGQPRGMTISEWVAARMRDAAFKARDEEAADAE